jgi:hypothetical protein
MFNKFVFIFVFSVLGATTRSVQVHPSGNEAVVVSGTWIWPTHCAVDSTFTVTDSDTMFFTWFSGNGKDLKDTLVVTKDTLIQRR